MRKLRRCSVCKKVKPVTDFYEVKQGRKPYNRIRYCKQCHQNLPSQVAWRRDNRLDHRRRLWASSYHNALVRGIEHTIKPRHIPQPLTCKYLGVEIDYTYNVESGDVNPRKWNGPSIDRIDPTRGYTPDNIQVISDLANRMKSNATVEQLLAFAEGVIRVHGGETSEAE